MRVAKSKYAKSLRKYQPGGPLPGPLPSDKASGLLGFLNKPLGQAAGGASGMMGGMMGGMGGMKGMGGFGKPMTAGSAIGMGIDLVSSFIPKKQATPIQGEGITAKSAEKYNEAIAKNQRTKQAISGGLSAAGDVASMIPGVGTAVGVGLKALGAAANFLPIGKGKEQRAMEEFKRMSAMSGQIDAQQEGARNYNAIAGFQAPAYGRHGMKFKTKYSKNVKF